MENQHRKITGYRELDETEIALMNKIKALGIAIEGVINEIIEHQSRQRRFAHNAEQQRLDAAQPWLAMGRSDLQTGLMKLTRAVAQPGFF
jgi:hypothetical protein